MYPSMTVGVLLETLRPVLVLIRNADCEGGDILTIWLRQATIGTAMREHADRLENADIGIAGTGH